jgi:hypothetical protein
MPPQLKALALLALVGACAFAPKTIRGALKEVKHDDRYEAPCGIRAAITHSCDEMPICCSYRSTVQEANGHKTEFWAFWPKYAPGLLGLVQIGDTATFRLHVSRLFDLQSCSLYGCPTHYEYTLDDDSDVVAVVP